MPPAKPLNPGASPTNFFGSELRHYRTRTGLTQEQLGEKVNYATALISAIETGVRRPQPDFARRCDEVLDTDGALERLMDMVHADTFPGWFRPWVEVESEATMLRNWEPIVIPGLLQTEAYARELLKTRPGMADERVEELAAARMDRKRILNRDDPPVLWFVVHESALHSQVGSPAVMREQLAALIEASHHSHVTIQVVPLSAGMHAGNAGAFWIASLNGEPDMVYLDHAREGQVSDRPEDVQEITKIWEAVRAEALPVRASLDLITKVSAQWT